MQISGIVPPDGALGGVTELRIHGVGGSTPSGMLGADDTRQVAGDRVAGCYRPAAGDAGRRHVEAYSWGGLTSRSRTRALWLLLLPFMLANLAGWTGRPGGQTGPTSRWHRGAARMAGLTVTAVVLLVVGVLSMDVIGYQCGGQSACVDSSSWLAWLGWSWWADVPARRVVVGTFGPLGLLVVFSILSYASRRRYEQVEPPIAAAPRPPGAERRRNRTVAFLLGNDASPSAADLPGGLADPGFWRGAKAHARLSRLHSAIGIAFVTALLITCLAGLTAITSRTAVIGWLVAGGCMIVAGGLLHWDVRRQWVSAVVLLAAVAGFLTVAVDAWARPAPPAAAAPVHPPGSLPRLADFTEWTWIVIVVLSVNLLLAGLLSPGPRRQPSSLGPPTTPFGWWAPFAFLGVGLLLAFDVLLSVVVFVKERLDPSTPGAADGVTITLPPFVQPSISWTVILGGGLLLAYVGWQSGRYLMAGRRKMAGFRADLASEYRRDQETLGTQPCAMVQPWLQSAIENEVPGRWQARHDDLPNDRAGRPRPTKWVRTQARWRRYLSVAGRSISHFVTALAVGGIAVLVITCALDRTAEAPLTGLTTTIAIALPPFLMTLFLLSWRETGQRRLIGVLWDVGTFWPRSFHPFAPPCYSERAVPELLRRIWWLNDTGGRVVLVAHSQGSLIAAAACLRRSGRSEPPPGCDSVGLVTFGSPLRKLYQWAFPAYLSPDTMRRLASGPSATGTTVLRWVNVFYPTDYIGGPIRDDHGTVRLDFPGLPTVGMGPEDVGLADPPTSLFVYGQPAPVPRTHTGYWADQRFRAVVDAVIDEVWHDPTVAAGIRKSHQFKANQRAFAGLRRARDDHPVPAIDLASSSVASSNSTIVTACTEVSVDRKACNACRTASSFGQR